MPLAAYCTADDAGILSLDGLVARPDGSEVLTARADAPAEYADALGCAVAKKLADAGAREIVDAVLGAGAA